MKVISFFSRFTLICNGCFLLFVFFSKLEEKKKVIGNGNQVITIPFFKNLIIILGVSAIVINLIMCIVYAVIVIAGKQRLLPKWLVIVNFLFLIFQFIYFFYR